jgi:hypothetical protein
MTATTAAIMSSHLRSKRACDARRAVMRRLMTITGKTKTPVASTPPGFSMEFFMKNNTGNSTALVPQVQIKSPLDVLVEQIKGDIVVMHECAFGAVRKAFNIGAGLCRAKELVKPGEWERWLRVNFKLSDRTARRYMQLAERRTEIETRMDTASDSSLRAALRLITAPKRSRHTVSPPEHNGHSVAAPKPTILQTWESWSLFEQRGVLAAMSREALCAVLPAGFGFLPLTAINGATALPLLSAHDLPDAGNDDIPQFLDRRTRH